MRVKITLTAYHREQASTARIKRGIEVPPNFEGPEFENVQEAGFHEGFYFVKLAEAIYRYPVCSIERIKEFEDPEPAYDPLDDDLPF